MAHTRQSKPVFGLDVQIKVLGPFHDVPFSLGARQTRPLRLVAGCRPCPRGRSPLSSQAETTQNIATALT